MKPSLRLQTQQQLALTPQIQQTIRMLQLGAKELSEEINQTLENNPLLQESKIYQSNLSNDDHYAWLENQPNLEVKTLEDHLIQQLGYLNLDSQMYVMACIVVSQLEDDGYLRLSTNDLIQVCFNENIIATEKQIRQSITTIQQLDPAGLACRNLAECLSLQLKPQKIDDDVKKTTLQIIENLDLLARDKPKLKQHLGVDNLVFVQALDLIQQLDPAPGKAFNQQQTIYIQPDIVLIKSNDGLKMNLNPIINRGIELNQQYIDLLKNSNKTTDRDYLRENLDQAKWWLNALIQRNKTLISVVEFVVNHQAEYFENGDLSVLNPLKQQQIADACGIHISTVSRALRNKYLQTPFGILLLKQFLSGSIKVDDGKSLSNQAVKSIIKNLIKNEPSQSPLSDSKIVGELKTRGIVIARRTVNKYREQLNIPASTRRKVT